MAAADTTRESLEEWRRAMFEELGFDKRAASLLASARDEEGWPISLHKTTAMIEAGCSQELALKILL